MRFSRATVLAIGIFAVVGYGQTQNGSTQNDSASIVASPSAPSDDPTFSGFQPMTAGIKPPKAISAPDPKYPDIPPDADPQGTVVLLIGVNSKGHVEAVRVMRSDEAVFEKTAVETVKKWKFKPAQKDGHPVPVQVTVEMKFQR
jgi:periplasmic protein TonB